MKKLLGIGALLLATAFLGCSKEEEGEKVTGASKKVKTFTIGTSADFKPFEYRVDGKIVGFDMDLLDEISKKANVKFEVKDINFAGLLSALQTNKIDAIMSGMSVTEERKKAVSFTDPYFSIGQVLVVREDENDIVDETTLNGKKVGVALGTTSDTLAQNIKGLDLIKFNKTYEAILGLKGDKIDAILVDEEQGNNYASENKGLKVIKTNLPKEEYAIAVNHGNEELLEILNTSLSEIVDGEYYNSLVEKHIGNK